MAMTPEQILEIAGTPAAIPGSYIYSVARAVEAEVRKDDEALIRQLVDALEKSQEYTEACANGKRVQWWGSQLDRAASAITAGRARLEGKP